MKQTLLCALAAASICAGCLDPDTEGNLVPATVEHDTALPQLSFRGSTFHIQTFGDPANPVLIFLHGGPGGDYRGLLRLLDDVDGRGLADDYFCVFWDQRGSGLSARHRAEEIDEDVYRDDLDWLVEHFSPGQPVVLVGHSWGGMYASLYISHFPEKVAGAVLMEPGPLTGVLYSEVEDRIIELDFFAEWFNDFAWAYRVLSPDGHARSDYLMMLGAFSDAQPAYHNSGSDPMPLWRLGSVAGAAMRADGVVDGKPAWDFTVGLQDFAQPVLFVASPDNTVIGEGFQRRQMQFYGNSSLTVLSSGGHDHPWTQAPETTAAILSYLDSLGLKGQVAR